MLIEDMKQELATINAMEYPVRKRKEDGRLVGAWPVLYCHPKARSPFIEYDEKEARRIAKHERQEKEKEEDRKMRIARLKEKERAMKRQESMRMREEEVIREKEREAQEKEKEMRMKGNDLRRTMSLVNLRRRVSMGAGVAAEGVDGLGLGIEDGDVDMTESANASGYIASGAYMAASGNSVSITSTTGTTSTAGALSHGGGIRNVAQLPPGLRDRIQHQVVTSRRVNHGTEEQPSGSRKGTMGPPEAIPERKLLRKSKSTNTLKLPKREEGSKPGYCECCRAKFDDFAAVRFFFRLSLHSLHGFLTSTHWHFCCI